MSVSSLFQNMASLVTQIGADTAADVGPALRDIGEKTYARLPEIRPKIRIMKRHRVQTLRRRIGAMAKFQTKNVGILYDNPRR